MMLLEEIYPGEILLENFMTPLGISSRKLSAYIAVSPSCHCEDAHGQRFIGAGTALRLNLYFSRAPRFSTDLQSNYNMRTAALEFQTRIAPHIWVFQPI